MAALPAGPAGKRALVLHLLLHLLLLLNPPSPTTAIKLDEFRTCGDTAFCRRQRSVPLRTAHTALLLDSALRYEQGVFTAALSSPTTDSVLTLEVTTLRDATVRARIFEPTAEAATDPRCAGAASDGEQPPACSWGPGEEGTGEWDEEAAGNEEQPDEQDPDAEETDPEAADSEDGVEPQEAAAEVDGAESEKVEPHRRPRYDRYDASAAIDDAAGLVGRRGQTDCTLNAHGTRGGKRAVLLECEGYTVAIMPDPFELSLETPGAGGEGGQTGDVAGAGAAAGGDAEPPRLALNTRSLLHYEQYEAKGSGWGVQNKARMDALGIDTDGLGEAEHHNGHSDLPRRGPASVGLDVDVDGATHVYGIPERAEGYNLKVTVDSLSGEVLDEPYRLWNLDVFEYEAGHPMPLYGAVPFLLAVNEHGARGMLWLNPSETYVDLLGEVVKSTGDNTEEDEEDEEEAEEEESEEEEGDTDEDSDEDAWPDEDDEEDEEDEEEEEEGYEEEGDVEVGPPSAAHWFSETGDIDIILFGGPDHRWVMSQYAEILGKPHLPPLFTLGYHQSRWNYKDDADVADVHAKFDEHDLPYDVLWLDIEHTDEKKYLTWDEVAFPDPAAMQNSLAETGRQMVVIVDPHLKADDSYHVFSHANATNLLVRSADGTQPYIDKCWPGESGWLDYFNPAASEYWSSQFLLENFKGATESLWIWNDMNEPSVFGGPEVTMEKSATHWPDGYGEGKVSFEHREAHNMYGYLMTEATFQGQLAARPGKRPFILSRAFFAGSQRHVAVWTGDSMASWSHLKLVTPMLLALSLSGISFVGSDIGGFFGNPEPELLIRWYETAIYTPFCRAHAHSDTARREPWLLEPQHTERVRLALKRRYALLPYLYTLFEQAHRSGAPIMRPLWYEFPGDSLGYTEQEGFMLGKALLVWPVSEPGLTSVAVRLPEGLWFDVSELFWASPGTALPSDGATPIEVPAPLGQSPLLLRAGSIVPLRERPRRATAAMAGDPVSLLLGVGASSKWGGTGELYSDDGATFRHRDLSESLRTRYQLRHIHIAAGKASDEEESGSAGAGGDGEWELSASTMSLAMMAGRETSAATYRLQAAAAAAATAAPAASADVAKPVSDQKGGASQWASVSLTKLTVLGMPRCPSNAEVLSVTDGSREPQDAAVEIICEKQPPASGGDEGEGEHDAAAGAGTGDADHDGSDAPRTVEVRLTGLLAHGDWKVRLS